MNELIDRFGSEGFQIITVPCNQFGHQENGDGEEILASLKYIRPGNGFVPKFPLTEKVDVVGEHAHPFFRYLRSSLPTCNDRTCELDMAEPYGIMKDTPTTKVLHAPRSPTDIHWNFEKFLLDKNLIPRYRFSPRFETSKLESYIKELLGESANAPNQ